MVNASKCLLGNDEVCYLGYVSKVEAIRRCPYLTTKKGVWSFLGLFG